MSIAGIILGVVGGGILLMFFSLIGVAFFAMNSVFSQQASVFTSHVANNEIDEAMKMTAEPVTLTRMSTNSPPICQTSGQGRDFSKRGRPHPQHRTGGQPSLLHHQGHGEI